MNRIGLWGYIITLSYRTRNAGNDVGIYSAIIVQPGPPPAKPPFEASWTSCPPGGCGTRALARSAGTSVFLLRLGFQVRGLKKG